MTHLVIPLLLREVDQGGEGEDADGDEKEEEAELLVGLPQRHEETLEAGEVADQLEYAQDPHHPGAKRGVARPANVERLLMNP